MTTTSLQKALLDWFDVHQRDLPWRATRDPYRIWVSEVMLQQTQVKTVVAYFAGFIEKYPDIRALAEAPLEGVLKSWEGMGYYARARNLHRAAGVVTRTMGGDIPSDYSTFRSLPGVGDYIAAAVMSIAHDQPYAVVDGNVRRVLARLFLIDHPAGTVSSTRAFNERADELLDRSNPGRYNQALMELGALVCTPKNPACGVCPVSADCRGFATAQQAFYPVPRKRRPTPKYHIAVGVIHKDDRILITRRQESGLLGGMWEFPGGKVRPGESPEAACAREISEEVSLSVQVTGFIGHVDHAYTHFRIAVDVFDCRYEAGEVRLSGPVDYRWILIDETNEYPFPAVNHKIFARLKQRDAEHGARNR